MVRIAIEWPVKQGRMKQNGERELKKLGTMNKTNKQTEMGITGEKKKEETTVTGKVMEMEKQM